MSDEREIIIELEERCAAATNAPDVCEFVDRFTIDAMLMMPDRPAVPVRGPIISHQREFFRSIEARIKSVVAEIEFTESMVYCRDAFNYSMEPKMGGGTLVMCGKCLNL